MCKGHRMTVFYGCSHFECTPSFHLDRKGVFSNWMTVPSVSTHSWLLMLFQIRGPVCRRWSEGGYWYAIHQCGILRSWIDWCQFATPSIGSKEMDALKLFFTVVSFRIGSEDIICSQRCYQMHIGIKCQQANRKLTNVRVVNQQMCQFCRVQVSKQARKQIWRRGLKMQRTQWRNEMRFFTIRTLFIEWYIAPYECYFMTYYARWILSVWTDIQQIGQLRE